MIDEWAVEHPENRPPSIVRASDGRVVAEVQHEKDADLVAAAPELLVALRRLLDHAKGVQITAYDEEDEIAARSFNVAMEMAGEAVKRALKTEDIQ